MSYPYTFKSGRSIQAAAFLLKLAPMHSMNSRRLLCLLTHADRECIGKTLHPITGSQLVMSDVGPIPIDVLNLMQGTHTDSPQWDRFIVRPSADSWLISDPGSGYLSRYTAGKLKEIYTRYMDFDDSNLFNITRQLPEAISGDGQSAEIPFIEILRAFGLEDDHDYVSKHEEMHNRLDDMFHTNHCKLPC